MPTLGPYKNYKVFKKPPLYFEISSNHVFFDVDSIESKKLSKMYNDQNEDVI